MIFSAVITEAEEGGYVAFNPETGTTPQGEAQVGSCGPKAHFIPAMGIAHGFAPTVMLRAESPV
jgi:hypothetical protein